MSITTSNSRGYSEASPSLPLRGKAASVNPLVKKGKAIHVLPWHIVIGIRIGVPSEYNVVVVFKGGRPIVIKSGYQRIYPRVPGYYQRLLVDIREQRTTIQATALSRDGWQVRLDVDVRWRVTNPAQIIYANQPDQLVQSAGRQVLRDIIQGTEHDRLLGVGVRALDSGVIVAAIKQRLNRTLADTGIKIDQVILGQRVPNPQRFGPVEQANIETASCRAALTIESQRNQLAIARNTQRMGVLDSEQEVSIKEMHNWLDRNLAQQLGNANLAKAAVEVDAYEQQRARQGIETENLRRAQQLEYERVKANMKYRAEAVTNLAATLTTLATAQGALAVLDQGTFSAIAALQETLMKDMSITPAGEFILGYENESPGAPINMGRPNGKGPIWTDDGYHDMRATG